MRKLIFFLVILLAVFQITKLINGVQWQANYDQATALALKLNKPRMVYFQVSWCGQCRSFEGGPLADWSVKKLAHQFVCIRLDAEKEKGLASRFNVHGYPTVVFLDHQGKVVDRLSGQGMGTKALLRIKMSNAPRILAGQPSPETTISLWDLFF